MICEKPDYLFPLQASIYYPIIEQGNYGAIKKQWVLDKIVACNLSTGGTAFKEEIKPNVNITTNSLLIGRVRSDIRFSSKEDPNSLTNVLISDVRDQLGNIVYLETSGPRKGKGTLFEIATFEPTVGPFGTVEFYKIALRRSENQGSDV